MSVFDLDTRGQETLAEEASLNQVSIDDVAAGAFHGTGKGTGMGFMRGLAGAGRFVGMAGGALVKVASSAPPVEQLTPDLNRTRDLEAASDEVTDHYFSAVDKYANNAVDYWTPSHAEVGKAGQVLGGFAEIVGPLMAGGGNPSLLIGTQEMGQATDLAREGVSPGAAVAGGVAQGLGTAVGFKLPFLGSSLTSRMLTGAAGNAAVNAGTTLAQHEILEATGQDELAKQYDPADVESRAVDVLTGLAFGAIAHAQAPRIKPSDVDAIATANNAKHFQQDTAPGTPADLAASAAHQDALETAIQQTLKGEPVSVPAEVTQAEFTPRDRAATVTARQQAFEDHIGQSATEETPTPVPDAVRQALAPHYEEAARVKPDFDAALRDIATEIGTPHEPALPRLKSVERAADKVASDYAGDATRLKDVVRGTIVVDSAEQAAAAIEAARKKFGEPIGLRNALALDSEPVTGEGYRDIKFNVRVGRQLAEIQINAPEILAAKKQVHTLYKERQSITRRALTEDRDLTPEETRRALELQTRQRDTYAAAWERFATRVRNSASDTSVPLWSKEASENRRPSGTSQARQIRFGVQEQGTPSTSANRVPAGNEAGSDIASTSSGSIAETAPGRSAPLDLDIKAAEDLLATSDLQVPTGEVDADGNPVTRSARELMDEADAEITKAQEDAKGIEAAVTCFLQRGNNAP